MFVEVPGVSMVGLSVFTTRLLPGLLCSLLGMLFNCKSATDNAVSATFGPPAGKAEGVLTPTSLA